MWTCLYDSKTCKKLIKLCKYRILYFQVTAYKNIFIKMDNRTQKGNIVFVAHGDTNFYKGVFCEVQSDGRYFGHMDNFMGVHCLMKAFFSGKLPREGVRVEITYGEEDDSYDNEGKRVDFAGARNVMKTLSTEDLVVVIDVTGTASSKDFLIEKCGPVELQAFTHEALASIKKKYDYELYSGIHHNFIAEI
jgi:hypothetical protein